MFINFFRAAGDSLIGAARFALVGLEVGHRDNRVRFDAPLQRMESTADDLFFILRQLQLLIGQPCRFNDRGIISGQSRKRGELRRAVDHRHLRVLLGNMVGQMYNVVILMRDFHQALCPPICLFRSRPVASF